MEAAKEQKTSRLVCKFMAIVFVGTFLPKTIFFPVYYQQIGISPTYIGILQGTMRFANAVGGVTLGYVSDRFDIRKPIFLVSLLAFSAMPVLVTLPQPGNLCEGKLEGSVNGYTSFNNSRPTYNNGLFGNGQQQNGSSNSNNDDVPNSSHNNNNNDNYNNDEITNNNRNTHNNGNNSNNNKHLIYNTDKNGRANNHDKNNHNDNKMNNDKDNNYDDIIINNKDDYDDINNNNHDANNNYADNNKNGNDDDKFGDIHINDVNIKTFDSKLIKNHNDDANGYFIDSKDEKEKISLNESSNEFTFALLIRFLGIKLRERLSQQVVGSSSRNTQKELQDKNLKLDLRSIFKPEKFPKKEQLLQSNNSLQNVFIALMTITLIGELIGGVAGNLVDALLVCSVDDKRDYPKLRLWGSLGQGVIVPLLLLGVYFKLIDICGVQVHDVKFALYIMSAISFTGFVVAIFKVYFPSSKIDQHEHKETKAATVKDLIAPLANWSLFVNAFFYGILTGTSAAFLLLTMTNVDPDQADLSMAVAVITRNITAILIYLMAPKLFRTVGYRMVMSASYLLFAGAFLVIAVMQTAWLGVLAESVEVAAYALSMAACVSYVGEVVHPSLAVTAQSLLHFMYTGIGPSIGPVMAGVILDYTGRKTTFLIFSGIGILAMIFSMTIQIILWRRPHEYQPLIDKDNDITNEEESEFDSSMQGSIK